MKLSMIPYDDGIRKSRQVSFGGYHHSPAAADGELYEMQNLSGDDYPLLRVRKPRYLCRTLTKPNGIYAREALCWVDGTGFYYDGARKGTVRDSKKHFCSIGDMILIFPDKAYYNTQSGVFGSLESKWSGGSLTIQNGTIYGEDAEANTLYCAGVTWSSYFRVGDAVTVSGCTLEPGNNKTTIIREIDGAYLRFSENTFTLHGDVTAYTENGTMKVERTVPELTCLCENENRVWGAVGSTVYASRLADPFNWNAFDGLDSDSWTVEVGSSGDFVGVISYGGYPCFFKTDQIFKVYGNLPKNFSTMSSAKMGLESGSAQSFGAAGEILLYLSESGVCAYAGGTPSPLGAAFGEERYHDGVAGSMGLKYYLSMTDGAGERHLFCYNTQTALWHREDDTCAVGFAKCGGCLYMLADDGGLWAIEGTPPAGAQEEAAVSWYAEFADMTGSLSSRGKTDADPNYKGVSKLQLRVELEPGSSLNAYLRFDDDAQWTQAGPEITAAKKQSYYLPIVPRRADHFRVKLAGTGACRIYSVVKELYSGAEF